MPSHRSGRSRHAPFHLLAVLAMAGLFAACGSTVATPTPIPTATSVVPTATAAPTPSPTAGGIATPNPSLPGQTDTAWGRIWDALPADFPTYPGAHPTETGTGPASATLDAGPVSAADVAAFYDSGIEVAGYRTIARSGPGEDGGWEVLSAGNADCQIRTTVTPLGGSTFVTILFGASCPFD
ncbi:MAG: hypothetical protein ABI598_03210 [Chloroflexota bacterium]